MVKGVVKGGKSGIVKGDSGYSHCTFAKLHLPTHSSTTNGTRSLSVSLSASLSALSRVSCVYLGCHILDALSPSSRITIQNFFILASTLLGQVFERILGALA